MAGGAGVALGGFAVFSFAKLRIARKALQNSQGT
jgi:hypothetical protein